MRTKTNKEDSIDTGFFDFLFNTLLVFVFLFTISFLLIKPENKDANIKSKAEFLVTVIWQDESPDDVDTWVEDPMGRKCSFKSKAVGLMHLDRDDLGHLNDTITMPDGSKQIVTVNQELTTIRGFIEGEWTVNIHYYSKRSKENANVVVRIDKLNPTVRVIFIKKITLTKAWEEQTVVRLRMSSSGDILSLDETPKKLIDTVGAIPGNPNAITDNSGGGGQ